MFFSNEVKMFGFVLFEKEVHIFERGFVTLTFLQAALCPVLVCDVVLPMLVL